MWQNEGHCVCILVYGLVFQMFRTRRALGTMYSRIRRQIVYLPLFGYRKDENSKDRPFLGVILEIPQKSQPEMETTCGSPPPPHPHTHFAEPHTDLSPSIFCFGLWPRARTLFE